MASAIYRSGFFCPHPREPGKRGLPTSQSPLPSGNRKTPGSAFSSPHPFTPAKLESVLSLNFSSEYSCTWAYTPSFKGTRPKPVFWAGAALRRRAEGTLAYPGAAPERTSGRSPAFLPLALPALPPSPMSQPSGWPQMTRTTALFFSPCLFSLLEKESQQWLCLEGTRGEQVEQA